MSVPKTSVSSLQEFCSKNKIPPPGYTIIADEEHGFICKVILNDLEIEEMGCGRSKRDAKHVAALAALKRLKTSGHYKDEANDPIPMEVEESLLPPVDMVMTLRDYCVQCEHPLPKFELVSQFGTPNAPRFTMLCQIASIKRYATSESKKKAKQMAASKIWHVIKESTNLIDKEMEIVTLKSASESEEEKRYKLFKTYRELVDSGEKTENFGVLLNERHNFFTRFHEQLKKNAREVLNTSYELDKTKAFDVLEALKLKPQIHKLPSVSGKEMLFIELDCPNFDACFAGFEKDIFNEIINYFEIMLT